MQTRIRAILDQKGAAVCAVSPGATVAEAVDAMAEAKVGSVLITSGVGAVLGIFTERDLMHRVVRAGMGATDTSVADVMTRRVVAVGSDTTVVEALAVITERRLRHLPVVDDGALVGLVSSGDLIRWLSRSQRQHIDQLTRYITGDYSG